MKGRQNTSENTDAYERDYAFVPRRRITMPKSHKTPASPKPKRGSMSAMVVGLLLFAFVVWMVLSGHMS